MKPQSSSTTYCTYCSAEKQESKLPLPSIALYKSDRISEVYQIAQKEQAGFVILSGKFGLLDPDETIATYDHLLCASEVEDHVKLVAAQLRAKQITSLVFVMNQLDHDPNLQPYLDCITQACNKCNIPLEVVTNIYND
jgi:hypothetical protein